MTHSDPREVGEGTTNEIMGRVARMQESTEKKMTQEVAQRMGGVEKKIDDQTKEIGKRFAQMNENVQKAVDELCRR